MQIKPEDDGCIEGSTWINEATRVSIIYQVEDL